MSRLKSRGSILDQQKASDFAIGYYQLKERNFSNNKNTKEEVEVEVEEK